MKVAIINIQIASKIIIQIVLMITELFRSNKFIHKRLNQYTAIFAV